MAKPRQPNQLEASWREKDLVNGKVSDTIVFILRTSGCQWAIRSGGCSMCGYRQASMESITEDDLNSQVDQMSSRFKGEPFVKIYTSGSFLDTNEVPLSIRARILSMFQSCERVLFESRPEYVTEEAVATLTKNVTIAFGLESSNDRILSRSVRKGFSPEDVRTAALIAKGAGLGVRSYLLLKPLYLSESMAIRDSLDSAVFADEFSDEISINPLNVQRGTDVELAWRHGDFRSPWVWSLVEVMREASGKVQARVMSSPSGGGSQRGVHNCGKCDSMLLESIERFSFSQDSKDLDVDCDCKLKWREYIKAEDIIGTSSNLDRGFSNLLIINE